MRASWVQPVPRQTVNKRASDRVPVMLPARLTWKDQRGSTRFASVVTRDVSEYGVFIECTSPISIPLFRLVQFQLERDARETDAVPQSLRQGRLLAAVYRVNQPTRTGSRQGIALRLMVDPRRRAGGPANDGESITAPQQHGMSDLAALA